MSNTAPICNDDGCDVPTKPTLASVIPLESTSVKTPPSSDVRTVNVSVISDNICPWCYVGKRRLESAISKLNPAKVKVNVHWRPFQLDPSLTNKSVDKIERYRSKFGPRVDSIMRSMAETGKSVGINFSYGGAIGNSINSHRLTRYVQRHHPDRENDIINALFSAYFENEKDIADIGVLADIAKSIGLDRDAIFKFLQGDELRDEVLHEIEEAYDMNVSGVPYFIIDNQYALSGAQEPSAFLSVFKKLGVVA